MLTQNKKEREPLLAVYDSKAHLEDSDLLSESDEENLKNFSKNSK